MVRIFNFGDALLICFPIVSAFLTMNQAKPFGHHKRSCSRFPGIQINPRALKIFFLQPMKVPLLTIGVFVLLSGHLRGFYQ